MDTPFMSEQSVVVIKDSQAGMKKQTEKRLCVFPVPELDENKGDQYSECFLAVKGFWRCMHKLQTCYLGDGARGKPSLVYIHFRQHEKDEVSWHLTHLNQTTVTEVSIKVLTIFREFHVFFHPFSPQMY